MKLQNEILYNQNNVSTFNGLNVSKDVMFENLISQV